MPARPKQAPPTPLPEARFAVEHAPQSSPAQDTTETPWLVGRTSGKEHIAARPVAGLPSTCGLFVRPALTLARRPARAHGRPLVSCPSPGPRPGQATLAPPAITPGLRLPPLPPVGTGPVLLLGPPAPPLPGRLPAGRRAVAARGMRRPKPALTPLEQTATQATDSLRRPGSLGQCQGVHGRWCSRGSSLGEEGFLLSEASSAQPAGQAGFRLLPAYHPMATASATRKPNRFHLAGRREKIGPISDES